MPKSGQSVHDQPQAKVRAIGRLSEAVPVYAAPDQDVCGVDMQLNSVFTQ